jgi:HSP20 family molecular chaperone IbpA
VSKKTRLKQGVEQMIEAARAASPMWPTRFFDSIFEEVSDDISKVFQQYRPSYPADYTVLKDAEGRPVTAVLTYALAGFKKDEISVKLVGNELRISAQKKDMLSALGTSVHHGIAFRTMEDSFTLWKQSDKNKVTSKFEDGLLTITVPLGSDDETVNVQID